MARLFRALTLVGLVVGSVACQVAPTPTPLPVPVGPMPVHRAQSAPAPGQLLFHQGGVFTQLELISGTKRAVSQQGKNEHVGEMALSPDGQLLALAGLGTRPTTRMKQSLGTELFLLGINGQGLRGLLARDVPNSTIRAPAWTPDGAALYFTYETIPPQGTTYRTVNRRVERINSDGSNRTVVVEGAAEPAVSPDGSTLAYVAQDAQGFLHALMVRTLDSGQPRTLVPAGVFDRIISPRYAPDGKQIAFSAANGPRLPIVAAPSKAPTGTSARTPSPAKPPAGDEDPFPWDVWLINADGTDLRRLTDVAESYPLLTWSPDGRWIAFVGDLGLHLVDLERREITLIGVGRVLSGVVWVPERRR